MTLIADVFSKLRGPKIVVRLLSEKSYFWGRFDKELGKRSQTLSESELQCLHHIYWSLWSQWSWETPVLVIRKILRLVLDTLTADDKYALLNRGNLTQPIHMQLSQKEKTFSEFLFAFLKSILNLEYFLKKDDPHSWFISEITDSKIRF